MAAARRRHGLAQGFEVASRPRDVEHMQLGIGELQVHRLGVVVARLKINLALGAAKRRHDASHVPLRPAHVRVGDEPTRAGTNPQRIAYLGRRLFDAIHAQKDLGQVRVQFGCIAVERERALDLGRGVLPALLFLVEQGAADVFVGVRVDRTRADLAAADQLSDGLRGASAKHANCEADQ